jgi:hypothetical protein
MVKGEFAAMKMAILAEIDAAPIA